MLLHDNAVQQIRRRVITVDGFTDRIGQAQSRAVVGTFEAGKVRNHAVAECAGQHGGPQSARVAELHQGSADPQVRGVVAADGLVDQIGAPVGVHLAHGPPACAGAAHRDREKLTVRGDLGECGRNVHAFVTGKPCAVPPPAPSVSRVSEPHPVATSVEASRTTNEARSRPNTRMVVLSGEIRPSDR